MISYLITKSCPTDYMFIPFWVISGTPDSRKRFQTPSGENIMWEDQVHRTFWEKTLIHISLYTRLHTPSPFTPKPLQENFSALSNLHFPMDDHSPEVIPITPEEHSLLEIAVRLACAIQYWEKNTKEYVSGDRIGWFQEGIENEMVHILCVFLHSDLLSLHAGCCERHSFWF